MSVKPPGELITFVIPTHDVELDLEACLASFQAQTFQDFEIRIVDWQSSDRTREIVEMFSGRLGRGVSWESEPSAGIYRAMNRGIDGAKGAWVCFFGADDVLYDARVLADVAGNLAAGRDDVVYGDVICKGTGERLGGEFSLDRLLFEGNVCHQAVFYRRKVFERVGRFNLRYPIWADWDLNIRCFRHPEMRTRWIDRLIAIYNDKSGASMAEDPVLRRELPVTLLRDAEQRYAGLASSRSTRYGRILLGWLDRSRRRSDPAK